MPERKTILAIAGSLRRGSYNLGLLAAAGECAPASMRVEVYDALADIPHFCADLCESEGGPEPVRRLRARAAAADGLLIATPEYNQSFPGLLKNAVDWLSHPMPGEVLAGKPVAVLGATPGRWGTRLAQSALRQVLCATECLVLPAPALYVDRAEARFDGEGRLTDPETLGALEELLRAFDRWIGRVSPLEGGRPT
jgi:chromate reductase, NAD(P)H dehydrogenase (quinone)